MSISNYLERHLAVTSCQEVHELCKPLYALGIHYFSFVRIYDDHSRISLCNHEKWQYYFYYRFLSEQYHRHHVVFEKKAKENDVTVWNTYPNNEALIDASTEFDLFDGVVIRKRMKDYCEIAHFSSPGESPAVIHFALNNLDLLKRFVQYFKETAAGLIKKQEANKIMAPAIYKMNESEIKIYEGDITGNTIQHFLNSIKTKRYHIPSATEGKEESYLTSKEYECLKWAAQGKTAEEIGLILNISKRTVEVHLERVKTKMHCFKLSRLIYDAMNQGIICKTDYV